MKRDRIILIIVIVLVGLIITGSQIPPEIPNSPNVLFWVPQSLEKVDKGVYNSLKDVISYINEDVIQYQNYEYNKEIPIKSYDGDALITALNNNNYGLIYLGTHGTMGWIGVEYIHKDSSITLNGQKKEAFDIAWDRIIELKTKYNIPLNDESKINLLKDSEENYTISFSSSFISNQITISNNNVIFINACQGNAGTNPITSSFTNSRNVVYGYNNIASGLIMAYAPYNIFYRMGGIEYNRSDYYRFNELLSDRKNITASEGYSKFKNWASSFNLINESIFNIISSNGNLRLYNAPRIVGMEIEQNSKIIYKYHYGAEDKYPYIWSYPGDNLDEFIQSEAITGYPIKIKILFSTKMQKNSVEVNIYPEGEEDKKIKVNGDFFNKKLLPNDQWEGYVTVEKWDWDKKRVVVEVKGEDANTEDIYSGLDTDGDGESEGIDTNHKFVIQSSPPIIKGIMVKVEEQTYYMDEWEGDNLNKMLDNAVPLNFGDIEIYVEFSKLMDKSSLINFNVKKREGISMIYPDEGRWEEDGRTYKVIYRGYAKELLRNLFEGEENTIELQANISGGLDKSGNELDIDPSTIAYKEGEEV